jgi:SAM-dependent methyltransferase
MGFCRQNIKALYYENKHKPIKGKFLCLGRQSVNLDLQELENIFKKKYILNKYTLDNSTRHAKLSLKPRITDKAFLENTFDVEYYSLDLNKYEGANIIADLNFEISKKYHKKFDFIFSGGVLDNLFNPSTALLNLSKLLKDNGRILIWEPSRGLVGSMLNFTPEYFYSYFSVNDYFDYKVYLLVHDKDKKFKKDNFDYYTDVFLYNPEFTRKKNFNYLKSAENKKGIHYVMTIAEKSKKSSNNKIPINLHYIKYVTDKKKISLIKGLNKYLKNMRKNKKLYNHIFNNR